MKTLLLAVLLLFAIPGCPPVDKNADATLVYIDRGRSSAFDILDQFVTWEKSQQPGIIISNPQIHAFAEEVRKNAPTLFHDIEAAESAYKAFKSPDNGDKLARALKAVNDLSNVAAAYLLKK